VVVVIIPNPGESTMRLPSVDFAVVSPNPTGVAHAD
jgi:hypothetical protein